MLNKQIGSYVCYINPYLSFRSLARIYHRSANYNKLNKPAGPKRDQLISS